ncbi:MAG: hypothetical protein ABTQ73_06825 [Caldilineales bacterium]
MRSDKGKLLKSWMAWSLKITFLRQKQNLQKEFFRTLLHQLMTGQVRMDALALPDLSSGA